MTERSVDVIVIGAGIGGLAAAIDLAAAGRAVRVLEAAPRPGGKAGVVTLDGVEVDTGPSVLTLPDVFAALLERAGRRLADELTLRRPEPCFRYVYADGAQLDVHHDLGATLASVRATLGPAAAGELEGFLAYARGIWEAAAPVFVYGDAPNLPNLFGLGLGVLLGMTRVDPLSTMRRAIHHRVRSPHLRQLLERYATYNGSDVRSAPATLNCIAHVELALGGYGVQGGMVEVVRALVRAAEGLGVEIQCDTRVRRVRVDRGAVVGVEADDDTWHPAGQVVCNAEVAHLVEALLPRSARSGIRVDGAPSTSGVNAIVRARRTGDRVAHTVLFPDDYEAEFADLFDRDRPPSAPSVYLCAQEPCHGRSGWADDEPVFLMANAPAEPARGAQDPRLAEALLERALERARGAGLLAPADAVLWRRSPADLAARFPGSRGALYGAASNDPAAAFRRPPNAAPRIRGLYVASGSAHPGGGIPLAALSGRAAARAALGVAAKGS